MHNEKRATRRHFLKAAVVASAGAAGWVGRTQDALAEVPTAHAQPWRYSGGRFPRAPVSAQGRPIGANDRILVAHIGVGGMGGTHVHHFKDLAAQRNTQSIAVCDVYQPRLQNREALLKDAAQGHSILADKDYRRILDNKDVDAVIIATPEHWHCQIAAHALDAGKHVYVEKPLSRYLDEAFQVYDVQRRTGKVVQVGAHGCSDPKYRAARSVIKKLGKLVSAQSSYTRNSGDGGEWNYGIDKNAGPDNLDWRLWLGSARFRPWSDDSRERFFRYRKYRDYSAGILGDLMPHRILPLLLALDTQDWPVKVHCVGTKSISTDREVSDTVLVSAEMSGGWTLFFIGSTVNEQGVNEMVRGHRANLYLGGNRPSLRPERPYAELVDAEEVALQGSGGGHVDLQNDFLRCIRENDQPLCNLELAVRAQALISLAEISEVKGKAIGFSPKTRRWKYV